MSLAIEIEGIPLLIKKLYGYNNAISKLLVDVNQISQNQIVADAKQHHSFRNRTYNLETHIQPGRVLVNDKEITAEVVADTPYASFVEYGTSRARAYPFMRPAIKRFQPSYIRAIRNVLKLAKKGMV